jgi:hypothetical protein
MFTRRVKVLVSRNTFMLKIEAECLSKMCVPIKSTRVTAHKTNTEAEITN